MVRDLLDYGAKLLIAITAGLAASWMHIWFVRAYGGPIEAGHYGWAASLHAVVGAALIALSSVIAPHMLDLVLDGEKDRSRHRAGVFLAATVLAAVAAPAVLGLVRAALAGLPERYAGAGPILLVLLATVPAQLMAHLATALLKAYPDRIGQYVVANLVMAGSGLVLNLVLTTRLGGVGAALALALSVWGGTLLLSHQMGTAVGAGAAGGSMRVLLAAAVASVLSALAAGILAPYAAVPAGFAASLILLLAARRAGLLGPLASFSPHLGFLPRGPRRVLTGFFDWCDTSRGKSPRDGTE